MKKKLLSVALVVAMVASLMTACGSGKSAEYKLGMGIVVEDSSAAGKAQIDATVATVITDANGKIVSCYLDVAQTKMTTEEGVIQDASEVDLRSKQEKGDDYNMVTYGGAIAEWYEQADFFAQQVVGKTADEVASLATTVNEEIWNRVSQKLTELNVTEWKEGKYQNALELTLYYSDKKQLNFTPDENILMELKNFFLGIIEELKSE